jgi:cytochrome P450
VWNVTDAIQLVSFDEDSYYQDPVGFFARLRESRLANKVHHWPGGGRSFPNEAAGVHALLNTDPPDHTRLRPLVQKAFTPRRAGQLRPRTKEIAAGPLDEMARGGDVVDLLGGYARPSRSR